MKRRYDIDWLRNFGILLLFPFHTARVFDVWDPFYVKHDVESWALSWFIALTSYWFMPLLFWLAGSASCYALERRSNRQYISERVSRLLIPMLVGTLLIVPPQGYFALKMQGEDPGNYFRFLLGYFTDFSDLSGYFGSFTPAHLWFLLYLFVFSLIALPLFRKLVQLDQQQHSARMRQAARWLSRPALFIALMIPLTAMQAMPAPGGQNPFYYFFIYVAGFLVCMQPSMTDMLVKCRFPALLVLLITVPVWLLLLYKFNGAASFSTMDILLTLLRTMNVWLTLIVIKGYGIKLLNVYHPWLSYASEAAFPIYVIHQTLIVVIGYFVIQTDWNLYMKFFVILTLSFAASCLLYEGIIKRFGALRWMFGIKRSHRKA